jgi:PPK2 family polyphosphate:nucleotide phosphotransferase
VSRVERSAPAKAKHPRLSDLLRFQPGSSDLFGHDPAATPGAPGDRTVTAAALVETDAILSGYQERLFAEGTHGGRRRLLLVLQGMDTSGKDGTIRHVFGAMNPLSVAVTAYKQPTRAEQRHDFLWRIERRVPGPGYVAVFNRSHYEDVLIVRVHGLVPEQEWRSRYERINNFERALCESGASIVKVFLHVSKDEQKRRLLERLDDPAKNWKFNPQDTLERAFWDDYQAAYADALAACSTLYAPWYVVPADRKWYRNWAVAQLLRETFDDMAPQYPPADFDVPAERARLELT